MTNDEITALLVSLGDEKYKEFSASLIPTVPKEKIIGVRIPVLRKTAQRLYKENEYTEFLESLPHTYFEENNLHAFLIEQIKDFDTCVFQIQRFLPYIDNWATCDSLSPKVFKKEKERLLLYIKQWLSSEHTYTVRFAIGCLMCYFLDEDFDEKYLQMVASVKSEEYYVNMMIAWFFATALAKKYESALTFIEGKTLSEFVHKKTIQKAVESYRISKEQKEYLKTLR